MHKKLTFHTFLKSGYTWVVLSMFLLNYFFARFPDLSTRFYTDGFFQGIRWITDFTLSYLPFPVIYLSVFILVGFILKWFFVFRRMEGWGTKLIHFLLGLLKLLIVLVTLFYLLWGFNYHSFNLKKRLSLEKRLIDRSYMGKELATIEDWLIATRREFISDSLLITKQDIPQDLEEDLRSAQKIILNEWGMKNAQRVRVRKLKPDGFLLRFSTAGIYIPHALEGHIDGGLHPVQWPATMAHEMGHGYSITDEGECNFIGFITCLESDNPVIMYSGLLMYYRYLVNNYQRGFMPAGVEYKKPTLIQRDINDCILYSSRYPDVFPAARDIIYDQYLKSHGIKEGLNSYSTIVQMVVDWKDTSYNSNLKEDWGKF